MTNFISGPSLPDITLCCHAMLHLRKTLFLGEGLGGHGGLRYCGIELFFFKGPLGNFDFNVRYCRIIQPCDAVFHPSG